MLTVIDEHISRQHRKPSCLVPPVCFTLHPGQPITLTTTAGTLTIGWTALMGQASAQSRGNVNVGDPDKVRANTREILETLAPGSEIGPPIGVNPCGWTTPTGSLQ